MVACDSCKRKEAVTRCSSCKAAVYCSADCSQADRARHANVCWDRSSTDPEHVAAHLERTIPSMTSPVDRVDATTLVDAIRAHRDAHQRELVQLGHQFLDVHYNSLLVGSALGETFKMRTEKGRRAVLAEIERLSKATHGQAQTNMGKLKQIQKAAAATLKGPWSKLWSKQTKDQLREIEEKARLTFTELSTK